jgi:hypothetical protein
MKIHIGPLQLEITWIKSSPTTEVPLVESIRRTDLPQICATTRGGYYAGEVDGYAIILSPIKGGFHLTTWSGAHAIALHCKLNGYRDWVLPTVQEMQCIFKSYAPDDTTFSRFKRIQPEAFRTIDYWTVEEDSVAYARTVHPVSLPCFNMLKSNTTGLRLIRRLKIEE